MSTIPNTTKIDGFYIEEIDETTLHIKMGTRIIVAKNVGLDKWNLWYKNSPPNTMVFTRKDAFMGTTMHAVFAYVDAKAEKFALVMY